MQPMIISHPFALLPSCTIITCSKPFSRNNHFIPSATVSLLVSGYDRTQTLLCSVRSRRDNSRRKDFDIDITAEDQELDIDDSFSPERMYAEGIDDIEENQEAEDDDSSRYLGQGPYKGNEEKDHDRDPEFAEIIGGFLDDPQRAQSRVSNTMR